MYKIYLKGGITLSSKYIIKDVLHEIARNSKGLTLFTNPAGSGKSYETSLMIADKIERISHVSTIREKIRKADKNNFENIKKEVLDDRMMKSSLSEDKIFGIKEVFKNIDDEFDEKLEVLSENEGLDSKSRKTEKNKLAKEKLDKQKNYLISVADDVEPERKIYYITPRIKNVDDIYEDIMKALENNGNAELKEEIVKVDSFRNAIIKNSEYILNDVTEDWQEAKELHDNIEILKDKKNPVEVRKKLEKMLFDSSYNLEYRFRHKLRKEFKKSYKANKKRGESEFDFMKKNWSFIEKIYPSVCTEGKNFFVLTSKKFFMKNDPIIKPSYFFTNKENIENAIVIIDEIDAIKTDMLDSILNNNLDNDVVDMFGIVYKVFQNVEGMDDHAIAITNSKERIKSIKEKSEELKEKYFPHKWEVRLYNCDENGKLEEDNTSNKIMNYQGVHSYYDAKQNYRYLPYDIKNNDSTDVKDQCNKILPEKMIENNEDKCFYISEFLRGITWFLNKTFKIFYNMAAEYMVEENRRIKSDPTSRESLINSSDSITTILGKLHFDRGNAIKLADIIISTNEYRRYYKKLDNRGEEYSFYDEGLYYSSVSEFDEFRHTNILHNYEIPYTPELMLFDLSKKANVIGISATAEVDSLSNFNMDYLKNRLIDEDGKTQFYKISNENRELLEKDYNKKTEGYSRIETKVEKISINNKSNDLAEELAKFYYGKEEVSREEKKKIADGEILQKSADYITEKNADDTSEKDIDEIQEDYKNIQGALTEDLSIAVEKDDKIFLYDFNRLKKVWKYIYEVIKIYKKEQVISNGIVITKKLVKNKYNSIKYKDVYTEENIMLGAMYILMGIYEISLTEAHEMAENMFVTITANELKEEELIGEKMQIFKRKFLEKKPVFMLTSYASVSRGNNLQVEIGKENVNKLIENGELLRINNWKNKGYIDWDSIYVEKPTYVIPTLKNLDTPYDSGIPEKISYKEKLEILIVVEELSARHDLDRYTKKRVLKEFFDSFEEKSTRGTYYNSLYSMSSIKKDYSIFIYQTIGRISRTNFKKRYNAIFYDAEIINSMELEKDSLNIPIITKEFERFLEKLSDEKVKELDILKKECSEEFREQNFRMFNLINYILEIGNKGEEGWYEELREFWDYLRKFVLKHPVISKKELRSAVKTFKKFKIIDEIGFDIKDVYLKFSKSKEKYYYGTGTYKALENNDFECVLISNDNRVNSAPNKKLSFEVSRDECRLSMLLNNEYIKDYWEQNNYNCDWKPQDGEEIYGILCPVIYNNIYKGIIGEEVVKNTLESIGIECEEITDPYEFEKFDFVVRKNGRKIYIDAKNFSDASLSKEYANEVLLDKTEKKVEDLNADYALIINIIDESGSRKPVYKRNFASIPGLFKGKYLNDCRLIREDDFDDESESVLQNIKETVDEIFNGKNMEDENE